METRELFWSLSPSAVGLFYLLAGVAIGSFAWGVARQVLRYRRGRPLPEPIDLRAGLARLAADLLTHRPLRRRDRFAGAAHAAIFFGFATAFAGTVIITLDHDLVAPITGWRFWHGRFYQLFSLTLDLGGLALAAGVVAMMVRRGLFRLARLDYRRRYRGEAALRPIARVWRVEDWLFLSLLLLITLSGFVQEGARLLMEQPARDWSPVGWAVAAGLAALPVEPAALRAANWWLHAVLAFGFIAALPWYKARHVLAALASLALRDRRALSRLPALADGEAGIAALDDLTWKQMLQLDACTRCGRCHDACPARAASMPLSPRDLVLDLRRANAARDGAALLDGVIAAETVWACRACGACKEICPVGIEHPVIIVGMRRALVDRGALEPSLPPLLEGVASAGNSFGEAARKRGDWTRNLPFRVKDARREPVELLWFVGDFASFDPRSQAVSRTVARLLRRAGVDFGILFDAERTAGNDIRRLGEEGLFESLAGHNRAAMAAARFSAIVTTDPHSYNTLRNEYPQFGPVAPIRHYSQLLDDLLHAGRLRVAAPLGRRVTLHDPCHLGRLNGEYQAPRRVLAAIGCDLVEMPRNRDNAFCCGAGGGRIWMPDPPGQEKPAQMRIREAAALGVATLVTCCPKDLAMFEDARKTTGLEDRIVVADLAELVAEAVRLEALTAGDVATLLDRIVEAAATRVTAAVLERLGPAPTPGIPAVTATAATPLPPPRPAPRWRPQPVAPAVLEPWPIPDRAGARLLVAVKHAARLTDDFVIGADGRIADEYLEGLPNEFDDYAVEQALLFAAARPGTEVVAVSVGPEAADETLRRALAKGADRAVRVWRDDLAEAEPLAVASLLAAVAIAEAADLVLTGVQSSDLGNGATGAAAARILGWPLAAVVVAAAWDGADRLRVTRELEGGLRQSFGLPAPAVLTIQSGANSPRYATMRMIKQARAKPLALVVPRHLDAGRSRVRRAYTPVVERARMIDGGPDAVAAFVAGLIRERQRS